jgi:hypothetical protein
VEIGLKGPDAPKGRPLQKKDPGGLIVIVWKGLKDNPKPKHPAKLEIPTSERQTPLFLMP